MIGSDSGSFYKYVGMDDISLMTALSNGLHQDERKLIAIDNLPYCELS